PDSSRLFSAVMRTGHSDRTDFAAEDEGIPRSTSAWPVSGMVWSRRAHWCGDWYWATVRLVSPRERSHSPLLYPAGMDAPDRSASTRMTGRGQYIVSPRALVVVPGAPVAWVSVMTAIVSPPARCR